MTRTIKVGDGVDVTLPPDARVRTLAAGLHQAVWHSEGERRTFTVTFTKSGRAVTQWFRRAESWRLLLNAVRSAGGTPHIYFGGVATGEEAYSLAMMLEAAKIDARITASDSNPEVLSIAEAGAYSPESIEQALTAGVLSPDTVAGFMRKDGNLLRVIDSVRHRVTFETVDLRAAQLPRANMFVLRNLWRHLGTTGAVHLALQVYRALPPRGVLSIGGADGLNDIEARTELDTVLRLAGLMPIGIHDLYFRE